MKQKQNCPYGTHFDDRCRCVGGKIKTNNNWEKEIYRIIDSFLVEAKDQKGNDRSLERLNQDRHLAAEKFIELFCSERQRIKEETDFELSKLQEETYKNEGRIEERQRLIKKIKSKNIYGVHFLDNQVEALLKLLE